METIESVATKLGITLTPHQLEMAKAVQWLTDAHVEHDRLGRSLLLGLAVIARTMNKPANRVRMVVHTAIIDDLGISSVRESIRAARALLDIVQGKTRNLGGDFFVDEVGRVRFAPKRSEAPVAV